MTTTTTPPAIAVRGLTKSFGDQKVLDGIDLDVPAGTVLGLLGPNGAGKTTLVNILATLIPADSGEVTVAGHHLAHSPRGVRRAIGVTGQFSAVDGLLTGTENLRLMADLHHLDRGTAAGRIAELLARFDLVDAADRPASTYSGGMRRRLDLAMTLMGTPSVIFLDEPTTGLDPRSRREVWSAVGELVASGVTVLLTTQYLDEADHLADRIAVLDGGRIVAEGTPAELKRTVPGAHLRLEVSDPAQLLAAAEAFPQAAIDHDAMTFDLPTDGTVGSLRAVFDRLDAVAITVERFEQRTPDLDEVFLSLTGRPTTSPDTAAASAADTAGALR